MRLRYKITSAIVLVAVLICLMALHSYALWVVNLKGETNIISVGCFEIEMQELTNPISLSNAYPASDAKGLSSTPYTIKITNTCSIDANYYVTLNTLTTSTMDKSKIKFAFSSGSSVPTSGTNLGTFASNSANVNTETNDLNLSNLDTSLIMTTGSLRQNESATYNLYLWIDESAGNEVQGQTFEASVKIVATAVTLEPSIQQQIIASLDTTGACPTVNDDGTVNVTGAESTNGYLCSATDDYGTSYYYRGNVTNNYVKFAGFYWRIIRINGDGSIRMIYAGDASVLDALDETTKQTVMANGYDDSSTYYTRIGESAFNSSYNDNAYVGYMYGTAGSSTYEETHANINNSTIKTFIDSWYESNIKGTEYESYLSDTLFCNDRSISSTTPSGYLNTGIGKDKTAYAPLTNYPRLTCTQQNDRFTVNDTTLGNGALTYPIGLITEDEASLAGGYNSDNYGFYLYTGYYYFALSPDKYDGIYAYVYLIYSEGRLDYTSFASGSRGVRPVLNLSTGVLKKGTGMWNDPYMVG